jgi:acetate kinase
MEEIDALLNKKSGILGVAGIGSSDMRDLQAAVTAGNPQAKQAMDMFVHRLVYYIGAYYTLLGGADAVVFTGGIGENGVAIRAAVCQGLAALGIELDPQANAAAKGEAAIHASGSREQIWVVPTNEEIIVARQAKQVLMSVA